jgi:hypothetical protein
MMPKAPPCTQPIIEDRNYVDDRECANIQDMLSLQDANAMHAVEMGATT